MGNSSKQTILIADDSPMNISVLCNALGREYNLRVATEGRKALEIALSTNPPDIILLDVIMPGMDGYEICRRLKEMSETKSIPVIFITALGEAKNEEYGLNLGALDYITKPFSTPVVKCRIRNHLELKKLRDMLERSSMLDGLTGIANRRRFDETLMVEWNRAHRTGSYISLIMFDIDLFKKYNNTYGHVEGDNCLRKVAKTIESRQKRPADLAARWGGEEFACILPDTKPDGALHLAKTIHGAVLELQIPHRTSDVEDILTVSAGVSSMIPSEGKSCDMLLKAADSALFRAKGDGRNRICVAEFGRRINF